MNEIILHQLSIGYCHKTVATALSATIRIGGLACLIGRNGLGKSTLLGTLAGFLHPLAGTVVLKIETDYPLHKLPKEQLARLVSVVLTDRTEVSHITVEQLVALGRMPYEGFFGSASDNDRDVVAQALQLTGLSDFAKRDMDKLSDGERQKVMIARALAQQTPVILLDEPTAFLDYGSKVETMRLLHDLAHRMDKLIVVSTHDLEIALHTADRLLTIGDDGLVDLTKRQLREQLEAYW